MVENRARIEFLVAIVDRNTKCKLIFFNIEMVTRSDAAFFVFELVTRSKTYEVQLVTRKKNFYKTFLVSKSKCEVILHNLISELENSVPHLVLRRLLNIKMPISHIDGLLFDNK